MVIEVVVVIEHHDTACESAEFPNHTEHHCYKGEERRKESDHKKYQKSENLILM